MLKRLIFFSLFCFASLSALQAQRTVSTASRRADLQVGVGFVLDSSDYEENMMKGFAFYTTLDIKPHWGAEFNIHQANSPVADNVYERTYEIGPRYTRTYHEVFAPYIKAMYGRGVFNFPYNAANLAYNEFAGGGGLDLHVKPWLNVRADYEYQHWMSFPPRGLTPQVITFGVAYHYPGYLRRGRHF